LFSRFSPAARRVLQAAEQECRNHDQYYLGAEHLLFALLEEHDEVVDAALEREAISVAEVHAEVKRALGTGDGRCWEGILVTPRTRKIVDAAEARAVGRDVEPIDLLCAIEAGGGLAAEILARARNAASSSGGHTT
jgi:ATP-dependent Clp protease ATP-binding subunit ClpA